jgi:WD40 repeat protein
MTVSRKAILAVMLSLGTATGLRAQTPSASFARDVKPLFARYCVECHNPDKLRGGLNLESFKTLEQGGENGSVFVAGKPDESRIVLQVEGKAKPKMPPQKAKQPQPEELKVLRAWIAAGAKDDSTAVKIALPSIKPRVPSAAPITALAYHPNGKLLAVGGYKKVLLIDLSSGDVVVNLAGQIGKVTALAFSPDGQHLAAASGAPGTVGEVRLYDMPASGIPEQKPSRILAAHADLIYDVTLSPDSKMLATTGYDRLIKLWDVASGKEIRTLRDHSDTVYSLSFSPDGKLLASGAADRAVKVWDVATGKRLYSLGESTDWVYAVAWSPDGRHLAAAGVDKSIRIWDASAAGGKVVQSVFAHEEPVTKLVYSQDGKTLYSASEGRTIKSWDTERMVERKTYPKQPEAILSLAIRPDHAQLALGRYDGGLVLMDEASGKIQSEPLPEKPKPPSITKITPNWSQRGRTIRITLEGKHLEGANELVSSNPKIVGRRVANAKPLPPPPPRSGKGAGGEVVQFDLTVPGDLGAGGYQLGLKSAVGQGNSLPFMIDLFPAVEEKEPNDSPRTGQKVALPAAIVGTIGKAGEVDFFRFEAKEGQQIGVQALTAAIGSKLEPIMELTDAAGQMLVESDNGLLGYICHQAGMYSLGIRDRQFRGGKEMNYRLQVGEIPIITGVFPLGVQRGAESVVRLHGVNLGEIRTVGIKAPANAAVGSKLPVQFLHGTPLGNPNVMVDEFPEIVAPEDLNPSAGSAPSVPIPGTANGRITSPGMTETWRFQAKKGQRLILEVSARRLGSPLDSYIEILDTQGKPVPRAVLRCLAKTYTTFRDHDSAGPGIRMETWSEFAINDYVLVDNDLMRIWALPKNPDDDCQFYSVSGQRQGFLETTPTHHSMGTPMYKVAIHPPDMTFPPNGFPVVTVYYHNDDGGPSYGKDSRLFFDSPMDGEYQVRIGDSRGKAGENYAYRLTIRPPRPSFTVSFNPTSPSVWKGGALPVNVTAERLDGFDGAIDVRLENLPPGFSAPATTIPAGETTTSFALWADSSAKTPAGVSPSGGGTEPPKGGTPATPPLKLVARAIINGKEMVREATGGLPKVVEPGDLTATAEQSEVTVQPGKETRLTVKIDRRNGFQGRVPLDVRGLPHGVRVLDIGLNGILITEKETSRTFSIYAEPWVQPTMHPFVVLAKSEKKNTEHAAKSVLLKVVK